MDSVVEELGVAPERLKLVGFFYVAILLLGMASLIRCIKQHQREPISLSFLTSRMLARAWQGTELLFFFLFYVFFLTVGSFFVSHFFDRSSGLSRLILNIVLWISLLATSLFIVRQRGESWSGAFGLGAKKFRLLSLSPSYYLASLPIIFISSWAFGLLLEQFNVEFEPQNIARMLFEASALERIVLASMAIIGAPFVEELVFRGILFPALIRYLNLSWAIFITSLLFSLAHQHLGGSLALFLLSVAFCLAYLRTGSLWVNIGMHALFNGINILVMLVVAK